jgi:hypothetical protein
MQTELRIPMLKNALACQTPREADQPPRRTSHATRCLTQRSSSDVPRAPCSTIFNLQIARTQSHIGSFACGTFARASTSLSSVHAGSWNMVAVTFALTKGWITDRGSSSFSFQRGRHGTVKSMTITEKKKRSRENRGLSIDSALVLILPDLVSARRPKISDS